MARDTSKQVDINSADEQELMEIEGIDGTRARLIVEYRQKNGPIESWQQLESIDGIGKTLCEKAQEVATLGDSSAGGVEAIEAASEAETIEVDVAPLLTSMARLDAEAAWAYKAAAESAEDADMRQHLEQFASDHLRHVDDLNKIIEAEGAPTVDRNENATALLPSLARMAGPLGSLALVETLLNNEQMTNMTYDSSLEFDWSPDVLQLLERNQKDEQRHLKWLSDREDSLMESWSEEEEQQPEST